VEEEEEEEEEEEMMMTWQQHQYVRLNSLGMLHNSNNN